ncbi:vWA domain-containing protein, partial [Gordonia desulfuricans]
MSTNRAWRRLRTLSVTLLAAALVAAVAGPALAAPDADTAGAGVDRFGSCVAAQGKGQVLLLLDESRSLGQSDPQAARITAARYLTEQLASFAASTGADLDVAVSGFSDDYHSYLGWTKLESQSVGTVTSAIDQLRDQAQGQDTDYWLALDGARQTLAQKRPDDGAAQGCQMIAWFTDGQLDFTPRPGVTKPYAEGRTLDTEADREAMIQAAQQSICRSGGLADQLRSSGVVTVAIGLASEGTSASDFDLLRSISTGQKTPAGPCGDITQPAPGDFYLAKDIDDLLFAFDNLSTPGQPPLTQDTGACVIKVCDQAKHRFVLDRAVGSVSILAAADRAGLTPVLVAPNGVETRMAPGQAGTAEQGGVKLAYRFPTDKSVSIQMSNPDAQLWTGVWALVFVADSDEAAKTRSSIHITGDLRPVWSGKDTTTLHSGDTDIPMSFTVHNSAGATVDPSTLPGTASLSTSIVTRNGKTVPIGTDIPKGQITAPRELTLAGIDPGPATLRMTLAVTTAAAQDASGRTVPGTELSPTTVDLPVVIDPPVGYPTIGSRIDFGTIEGSGTATAALTVTGPGCVWLDTAEQTNFLATPDGSGELAVGSGASSQQNCVQVDEKQTGRLELTFTAPQAVNGTANGTVTVMVAPKDGSAQPLPIEVPFTVALQKPLDTADFAITLVVALVLGPLIPLLLLYLAKWYTARIPGHALRAEQFRVRLNGTAVVRDNGAPFAIGDRDFIALVPGLDGPTRRIDLGGVTLRTRIGRSPFGVGFVTASAPGMAGAAGRSGDSWGKTPDARLPLAVHNTWFVLHDPTGPENTATVVMLVGGDADRGRIDQLVREVSESLPRVLPALRTKARARLDDDAPAPRPGGDDNPFGGPGGTPSGGPGGTPSGGPG